MHDPNADPQQPWWVSFFDDTYQRVSSPMLTEERTLRDIEGVESLIRAHLSDAPERPIKVLDVCGGDGRVAARLDIHKFSAFVIDASPFMIEEGLKKGTTTAFLQGDARAMPWAAGEFDVALNLFSAFGYFDDDFEHLKMLAEIGRCVREGGLFILDLTHRDHFVTTLTQPSTWYALDDGSPVWRHCAFDPIQGVSHERLYWVNAEGLIEERQWRCRIFTATEIASMLRAAKLEPIAWYGSLSLEPFACDGPGLCVVARRLP